MLIIKEDDGMVRGDGGGEGGRGLPLRPCPLERVVELLEHPLGP